MFKGSSRILSATLCIFAGFGACSAFAGSVAYELYTKSDLVNQVRAVPVQLKQSFREALARSAFNRAIAKKDLARIDSVIEQSFNVDLMERTIVQNLNTRLGKREMRESLNWYNSSLGRKISQLHKEGVKPELRGKLGLFQNKISRDPLPMERSTTIKQIIQASQQIDYKSTIVENNTRVIGDLFNRISNQAPQTQQTLASYSGGYGGLSNGSYRLLNQQAFIQSAFDYQTLSQKQLEQYLEFNQSSSASRFFSYSLRSLELALGEASRELSKNLQRLSIEVQK